MSTVTVWYINLLSRRRSKGIAHIISSAMIPVTPTAFFTSLPAQRTVPATLLMVLPIPGIALPALTIKDCFACAVMGTTSPCTTLIPITTPNIVFISVLTIS